MEEGKIVNSANRLAVQWAALKVLSHNTKILGNVDGKVFIQVIFHYR